MSSSAEIRRRLGHPVIDIDGHMAEHLPTLAPVSRGRGAVPRPSRRSLRLAPPYGGTDRTWHEQTPEERAATRTPRGPWWSAPAGQTIDLATALFPALLYERLDELGIDFGVVYPSLGLVFLHTPDEQLPPGHLPGPQPGQRRDLRPAGRPADPGGRHPHAHPRRGGGRARVRGDRARVQGGGLRRLRAAPVRRPGRQGSRGVPVRLLARPVRHRLAPTTTTRCGPRPRSSACRSPSTPASSG